MSNTLEQLEKEGIRAGHIESRKCEYCGHHEVGIRTLKGDWAPLKSGDRIAVKETDIDESLNLRNYRYHKTAEGLCKEVLE